ncbi:MAG: sulfatase activating formylglycine-generating enzyme, partial [Kiritimatiellia bacterium]
PRGMIYVPPGPYISGRMNHDPFANKNAERLHETVQIAGFMIDAFEFPNEKNGTPTARTTWKDAQATCKTKGKRLCSTQEWEKACKGPLNYIYSYGDTWDESFCGEGMTTEHISGQNNECRSGWGVFDMSGGLKEWTGNRPPNEPSRRVVKGGTLSNPEKGTRCAYTSDESANYSHATLAFRCCRDVDAPPIVSPAAPEPADTDTK